VKDPNEKMAQGVRQEKGEGKRKSNFSYVQVFF
jgi:hypothetical protein